MIGFRIGKVIVTQFVNLKVQKDIFLFGLYYRVIDKKVN